MSRFLLHRPGPVPKSPIIEFYREEFVKHHRCLQQQREYYSSQAISHVETALLRIISQVETLSATQNADQVIAKLLREFDVVTRLSDWSDQNRVH